MKLLVVDDDLVSRAKMGKLLSALGHKVVTANDGDEGWDAWQSEQPDVIVMDWVMPGMDGPVLCEKIRKAESVHYTYIIMVTSKSSMEDLSNAMSKGVDDFIVKPFRKAEVIARLGPAMRIINLQTRDIVIFSLAKLAESRDSDTGEHLDRIRHFSKILAENLLNTGKLDKTYQQSFVEDIFLTSPLHDIGKVGIADSILRKPGKFTADEFNEMKKHSQVGYETLNQCAQSYPNANYLQMAADIALNHHEKFDGSGYPNGLSGEDIPLAARVVALADVYDALTQKRVYKEAFTHEAAYAIILEGRGNHFDPMVVDAFIECESKFIR
ncbi:HD domain-containing phosphohydrolase, partial [Maridesulfovibrio frigidus]|uniref:HD domain-containing phosphohydrolase n=1 Tax=Maridesulfovibrio frigidus TaxID=340956 RepID=UPI0004E13D6F